MKDITKLYKGGVFNPSFKIYKEVCNCLVIYFNGRYVFISPYYTRF